MWDFPLFPDQASSIAHQIDLVYFVLIGLASVFGFGVAAVLVFFAIKYRAGNNVDRSNLVTNNLQLEVTWMIIPLGLAMGMFVWGAVVYYDVEAPPPEEPIEIYAVGKQWMWKFQHANGAREINTLHVPTGRPVKMITTSQDVIHSFFVPAFRVKQDVLPGRFTTAWFEATKPGTYHLFCAEYCGSEHSYMEGDVVVMSPQAYEEWLRLGDQEMEEYQRGTGRYTEPGRVSEGEPVPGGAAPSIAPQQELAAAGEELFGTLRCNTCHRTDSSAFRPSTGPVLEGVYGRDVLLRNGRQIVADEQYLLESILYPYAKLVRGYPPVMPTYAGQINEEQLMQLVAYLKSLAPADTATIDSQR